MNIGFDAKRLYKNCTGLGNYSRTLVSDLAKYYPDNSYYLFTPKVKLNDETTHFLQSSSFETVVPSSHRKILWRSLQINGDIKRNDIDLYHGLSNELPVELGTFKALKVVTIHDVIFRHYPQRYSRIDRSIYNWKTRFACNHADVVIAISNATKQDIIENYNIASDRIRVIYQSCDDRFLRKSPPSYVVGSLRKKYNLPEAYSLYVGSLIERKNLLGVVEALGILRKDLRMPLVIVGGGGAAYRQQVERRAKELNVHSLLHFVQVTFDDLPSVYQEASVFLYPSFAEGFGIPVLEALNSRVPVITSNISSLPEAAGPHSCLVNPSDPAAIAHAWHELLTNTSLVQETIDRGYEYAKRFRSDIVVPQVMNLYQEIAG